MVKYYSLKGDFKMNKELIVLTDELMLVRNETGEYEKREYISNAKEVLLQENKIEMVTNQMKELKKEIEKCTTRKSLLRTTLIMSPLYIPLTFLTNACFSAFGMVVYENLITILMSGLIMTLATALFVLHFQKSNKKNLEKTRTSLVNARILKHKYENELSLLKKKSLSETKTLDEVVSLEEETKQIQTQVTQQINGKPLVLKRKKQL
jgi:predicted transcriptional regulator